MGLDDARARARAAYPEIEIDDSVFAARAGDLDDAHAADLWLAIACSRGDAKALAIVEEQFLPEVARGVAAVDPSPTFADEVIQELREKLLVARADGEIRFARYDGRGSLVGWLRVIALRIALDMRRKDRPQVPIEDQLIADADPARSPEEQLARRQHAALLERALRETVARQSSRTRAILRYHYGDRATLDELAAIYNVHRATISRWLMSAREEILDGTRRFISRELGITADEADSLLGLAHSLEVSLHGLLATRQR